MACQLAIDGLGAAFLFIDSYSFYSPDGRPPNLPMVDVGQMAALNG
jgi:hypothetical protein